jgi:hypothetical protein
MEAAGRRSFKPSRPTDNRKGRIGNFQAVVSPPLGPCSDSYRQQPPHQQLTTRYYKVERGASIFVAVVDGLKGENVQRESVGRET